MLSLLPIDTVVCSSSSSGFCVLALLLEVERSEALVLRDHDAVELLETRERENELETVVLGLGDWVAAKREVAQVLEQREPLERVEALDLVFASPSQTG